MKNKIKQEIQDSIKLKQAVEDVLLIKIEEAASLIVHCLKKGGKVAFCGNGGSAADAQHLAAELIGRFRKERASLPAIAFTTNTSILTAIGNDYGYDKVFSRQAEGLLNKGDILLGISTSGNSANVIQAFKVAKNKGAVSIALTGEGGGQMKDECDLLLAVPSKDTPRVQEAQIMIGHIICGLVEDACNQ
ncbi:MAG: D-sedoheptulose 7-phosphate isomerase [Candidatus Margulisiibacteriota bacterium]|jgi:D-sedoheptulose 7-phosphate isomerase